MFTMAFLWNRPLNCSNNCSYGLKCYLSDMRNWLWAPHLLKMQFSPTSEHLLLAYGRRHGSLLKSIVIDGDTTLPVYTILEVSTWLYPGFLWNVSFSPPPRLGHGSTLLIFGHRKNDWRNYMTYGSFKSLVLNLIRFLFCHLHFVQVLQYISSTLCKHARGFDF